MNLNINPDYSLDTWPSRVSVPPSNRTQDSEIDPNVSAADQSLERPLPMHQTHHEHRLSLRTLMAMPSIAWISSILSFKSKSKTSDRVIVSTATTNAGP